MITFLISSSWRIVALTALSSSSCFTFRAITVLPEPGSPVNQRVQGSKAVMGDGCVEFVEFVGFIEFVGLKSDTGF